MVSESYKRIKYLANDKIDKYGSDIKEKEESSYGNPMLYIFAFIIFLLIMINLF